VTWHEAHIKSKNVMNFGPGFVSAVKDQTAKASPDEN